MNAVNFRLFNKKLLLHRKSYRRFINRLEKNVPKNMNAITAVLNVEVFKEIDCLSCANCCKKMTPTFTVADVKRAAAFVSLSTQEFKEKWLIKQKDGDWVNVKQPCQFLNLKTNMCNIYEARPADCAGFPHLAKKKFDLYAHVHRQNIDYCPATFKMVEKLADMFN